MLGQHFHPIFSLIGTVNTYDVCKQIAVRPHLFPLDVTTKQPMVSIAKTTIVLWDPCHAG